MAERTDRLPLILLPPSEGKASGGTGPPWQPATMAVDLDLHRARLMRSLAAQSNKPLAARQRLLGVKGDALAAATEANRHVADAPTIAAIERYTGVLYDAIDVGTLSAAARRRLDASVMILSGLWGAVSPADPIPDYKLKMGAALPRIGKLSTFWRPHLSAALEPLALGEGSRPRRVWNLLPNEHAAALSLPDGAHPIHVRFLERSAKGELVAVSHWNKLLKGALVRLLVEQPGTTPEDLAEWDHPLGYRLDPSLTRVDPRSTTLSLVQR